MMLPRGKIPIVYGHCDDVFGEISTLYSSYNILTVIFLLVYLPTSRNVFIIMFICSSVGSHLLVIIHCIWLEISGNNETPLR